MAFLLSEWKMILAIVVLGALTAWALVLKDERDSAREAFAKYKIEVQNAVMAQEAKNAAEALHQQQMNQQLGEDYAKTITAIRAQGNHGITCAIRVREPAASGGSAMSSQSGAASGPDATPADALVVENLPEQCAETTKQLISLQRWILTR